MRPTRSLFQCPRRQNDEQPLLRFSTCLFIEYTLQNQVILEGSLKSFSPWQVFKEMAIRFTRYIFIKSNLIVYDTNGNGKARLYKISVLPKERQYHPKVES